MYHYDVHQVTRVRRLRTPSEHERAHVAYRRGHKTVGERKPEQLRTVGHVGHAMTQNTLKQQTQHNLHDGYLSNKHIRILLLYIHGSTFGLALPGTVGSHPTR